MTQETARATDPAGAGTQAPDADAQAGGVGGQAPADSSGAPPDQESAPDQQSATDAQLREMENRLGQLEGELSTATQRLQQTQASFDGEVDRRVGQARDTWTRKDEEARYAAARQKALEGDTAAIEEMDGLAREWRERPQKAMAEGETAKAAYNEGMLAIINTLVEDAKVTPEETQRLAALWQSGNVVKLLGDVTKMAARNISSADTPDPKALKEENERLKQEAGESAEQREIADSRKVGPETAEPGRAGGEKADDRQRLLDPRTTLDELVKIRARQKRGG